MRKPLQAGSETMNALEEAVNLLRAAPLSTLLLHWIGSAPFVLGLLLFWSEITQYRPSNAACAADALALAVLLAWMNCWRASFAARMRAELGGAAPAGFHLWRMVGYQTLLGASKLIVLPVAALIVFPLASTVAFYRYVAVLSCRADLSFRQVTGQAAKLAGIGRRQSWAALPAVAFLQMLVTLNVALALAMLPQLVRMLTGYESVFSRAGLSFMNNPLFIMSSLAVGWMTIDPFIQAVYCVMFFRRESLESGEDLRAALRGLRRATMVAAAVLCACVRGFAVTPEPLRKAIDQTMRGHEYDWRLPPEVAAHNQPSWLIDMVQGMFRGLAWILQQGGRAIGNLLKWIFGKVELSGPASGAAPAHALSLGMYVVIAVILILAGLLAARIVRARRQARPRDTGVAVAVTVRLEDENVAADQLPEDQWIEMAERMLREQNFRLALRAYYLANLAWMGWREWIAIHAGKTNREYENDLRRRARGFGEARGLFAENIAAFERVWYGRHETLAADVEQFRERNSRMKTLLVRTEAVAA